MPSQAPTSPGLDIPHLELPKGGGALRGIDETFLVNASNGTAGLSVSLPFGAARGVTPNLTLAYSSGSGNGVFGLGWSLSLASIKRKTDKGLPQYHDGVESDVFLLSDAEDLVPEFKREPDGSFSLDGDGRFVVTETNSPDGQYRICRYRPRIEGGFNRIERWAHLATGILQWRVISRDNVTTLYGWTNNARISDPDDARRTYAWLPEWVFDDKGNCAHYLYTPDDDAGFNPALLHHRNRRNGSTITYTNLYLTGILYGNRTPYRNFGDPFLPDPDFMFSTVLDYGERDENAPWQTTGPWMFRADAFSDYKPGFEVRTTRLCRRVLLFHHFDELPGGEALVQSLHCAYTTVSGSDVAQLSSVTMEGYLKDPDGTYTRQHYPPLEMEYQPHAWNRTVQEAADAMHAPAGLASPDFRLFDLYNEGLPGILAEQSGAWYYKRNRSGGAFDPAEVVARKPSYTGLGGALQLLDLEADGGKQLVRLAADGTGGYFEWLDPDGPQGFKAFEQAHNLGIADTNARLLDLDGDGKPDVLLTEDNAFVWYASLGKKGYEAGRRTEKPFDEERGPALVFADGKQTVFLADMSGDGLTDLVRIRNGEVCYWPNRGYGRFGSKVGMDNAPWFDAPDTFDPAKLQLADVTGTGTSDIVYFGANRCTCWLNRSGNAFETEPFKIDAIPGLHNRAQVMVADFLGTGLACIVWSSPLNNDDQAPLRYIDLMGSTKPYLLRSYRNNLGKETTWTYRPSTQYYLDDRRAGRPWVTQLHFPVHCVDFTETRDLIADSRTVQTYRYHHGYYDRAEREFRGFGMVEQIDVESTEHWTLDPSGTSAVDQTLQQKPVLTRRWYHTGAFLEHGRILDQYAGETWHAELIRQGFAVTHHEHKLPEVRLMAGPGIIPAWVVQADPEDRRAFFRACKGMVLRTETFTPDAPEAGATPGELLLQGTPHTVSTSGCVVELLQPRGGQRHAVMVVKESEAITYHYERNTEDPRVAHQLNIRFDEYANVLESASVMYGRRQPDPSLPATVQAAQSRTVLMYSLNRFTNDVSGANIHRLRVLSENESWELRGVSKTGDYFSVADFNNVLAVSVEVPYQDAATEPGPGVAQRRLVEHVRHLYYRDDLAGSLPLHQLESHGLAYENYRLAFTPALISHLFGARVTAPVLAEGGYVNSAGDTNAWAPSGVVVYTGAGETAGDAADRFWMPVAYLDPFGGKTRVTYYGNYNLLLESTEDALGNVHRVELFNFRTLRPQRMRDPNNNLTEVLTDALGLVKAFAQFGKGNEADNLAGLEAATRVAEQVHLDAFWSASDTATLLNEANQLLQHATARYVYDVHAFHTSGRPVAVASILREQHFSQNPNAALQLQFEYSGGGGQAVGKKVQADPGKALQAVVQPDLSVTVTETDTAALNPPQLRWIGSGRTVFNNKGNPVKQYEPYFSVTPRYEDTRELVASGLTPLMHYDALGRKVRIDMPNGTHTRVVFDAWMQSAYDQNDTLTDAPWFLQRTNHLIDAALLAEGKNPAREKAAADAAILHADTPATTHFDSQGRPVMAVEHNRDAGGDAFFQTFLFADIEGNLRQVIDARGNTVVTYRYDMLGNAVVQASIDTGQRWLFKNVLGKPVRTWDERNHEFRYTYDVLQRPLHSDVLGGDGPVPLNHRYERMIYGESQPAPEASNLRGKLYRHYDTGSRLEMPAYDFKGKPVHVRRRLFRGYKDTANWIDAKLETDLEGTVFNFQTVFDALGRPQSQTQPDGSVLLPEYNRTGLLQALSATHPGQAQPFRYVDMLEYNARSQRERMRYGNGVRTRYTYDKLSFRLIRMETILGNGDPLQDWRYTYDAVGNVTHVEDANEPFFFFNNQIVTALSTYVYDALYRLIQATGRENAAAFAHDSFDNWNDAPFLQSMQPGDPMALRSYTQSYAYDAVGNLTGMNHQAEGNNWNRLYTYENTRNRLSSTTVGIRNYSYAHHAQHGFITGMPHLDELGWSCQETLVRTIRQRRNDGGTPETTYYQYDAGGKRLRVITENQAAPGQTPTLKNERITLGSFERFLQHSGPNTGLERTTILLAEKNQCFALVERRNGVNDGTDAHLVRFQLHDHLGSSALELDATARIISYENYHPYGTTACQARNASVRAAAKRYRYTGMERDEESGLSYHNSRYYLPWLGRWLSADPGGLVDGVNLYRYARNRPVVLNDPNGMDPPGQPDPVTVTPLLTQIDPLVLTGRFQLHEPFSSSRSLSGSATIGLGARTSFALSVPPIGLDTTGIADVRATADVDTAAGTGTVRATGGLLLGDVSGLNLALTGSGTLTLPLPERVPLTGIQQTFLQALPRSEGEASVRGVLSTGNFALARFRASASLDEGNFQLQARGTTIGDLGTARVEASGSVDESGTVSLDSLRASASVSIPVIAGLDARLTGTAGEGGSLNLTGSADLRLFGLPSLSARGTGTASTEGVDFSGTFSGAGPLYTSYIAGDFTLSTSRGVGARALVAGLTYSPSISITDPQPPTPGELAVFGAPRTPSFEPGGLTVGVSLFNYSQGNLSFFSAGFMPDLSENILSNPRFGFTAGFHFSNP